MKIPCQRDNITGNGGIFLNRNQIHSLPGISSVPAHVLPLARIRAAAEVLFLFFAGGAGYYLLEVLFRGYSHPSMAVCGGICFLLMYTFCARVPSAPLLLCALVGSVIITGAELITGIIVNLWLGLGVWDYSHLPMQFLGQICLPFSALWFALSIPVMKLCRILGRRVFSRN